jgi:HSP20 family protein
MVSTKAGIQPRLEDPMAKAETSTKVPVTTGDKPVTSAMHMWRPFEKLRREVDRLFDDFYTSPFRPPFRRPAFDVEPFWAPESWVTLPAVDFVERDDAFEMTADLPGLDEKNIELKVANGVLTIKGEKTEEKEEKEKEGDFHLRERRFGSFERSFRIPETVDMDKIEASFKHGVLTLKMPKTAEAQTSAKKIEVKGG